MIYCTFLLTSPLPFLYRWTLLASLLQSKETVLSVSLAGQQCLAVGVPGTSPNKFAVKQQHLFALEQTDKSNYTTDGKSSCC